MRIDREAFLLAVSAIAAAGCERADAAQSVAPPAISSEAAEADVSLSSRMVAQEPAPKVMPPDPKPAGARLRPVSAAVRWFRSLEGAQASNIRALCKFREENPCAGMFSRLRAPIRDASGNTVPQEDPEEQYVAGLDEKGREHANQFCAQTSSMPAPNCETPLVVAFENEPVALTPATSPARDRFAFVPGAAPMTTDWPTATTPWIALDRDGDGAITTGAELFGSSTPLAGGLTARNGFEGLAALDGNGDGVVDARDPMFASLLLWSDTDGDRRSSPGELRPLSTRVTAISLDYTVDPRCDARDNCEGERARMTWRDASGARRTGTVIDIYLARR